MEFKNLTPEIKARWFADLVANHENGSVVAEYQVSSRAAVVVALQLRVPAIHNHSALVMGMRYVVTYASIDNSDAYERRFSSRAKAEAFAKEWVNV